MTFLDKAITERILFAILIIGLLLGLYGVVRVVDISIKLSNNIAQQIHDSGEELNLQSTAEGRGIMTADLERRELLRERGQMIMFVGIGIVLLGVGWLGYDLRNSRRKKEDDEPALAEVAETG